MNHLEKISRYRVGHTQQHHNQERTNQDQLKSDVPEAAQTRCHRQRKN